MNTNERIKIFKSLMGQVFGKEDVDYFVATLKRMGYFTAPGGTYDRMYGIGTGFV